MNLANIKYSIERKELTIKFLDDVIWNEAIEVAAQMASDNSEGCIHDIANKIRKLKKDVTD